MKQILTLFFILCYFCINAQVVTTDPEFPVQDQSVTITFDASLCDCNLIGYTGDLYTHTGITIEGLGRWEEVIGNWGDNAVQPQLTRIGTDLYELEISPSINDFYTVTGYPVITEMCFVFRSADGSQQSADIFVDVFSGEGISIISPDSTAIYSPGIVNINAIALFADTITLFINENEITTVFDSVLNYDYNAVDPGINTVRVSATDGSTTVEKETFFFLRGDNVIEDLPSEDLVDGINYIDDNTVTLVLYAPFKEFTFVKGSFDDWDLSLSNQMKQTTDSERYWITLTGLTSGEEYIYQYVVDGTITIADPYADKLSDPWNDSYISNTTYPDLIDYPSGKTSGIASVFQTAQTPYTWAVDDFVRPDNEDLIIYELLIRDFVAAHDYQTLIDTINYLKDLGINAVELMPVNEFEGNSSWGYNSSFYFAPDKYYGTKDKLKEFIDVCHQNDIAVIMDIVLNHSYGQSPLVQLYFDPNAGSWGQPTPENPWYNETSPNPDYSWGYDFDHESLDTKIFVSRVVKYWLNEYKFDGFRFDFTKGFTNTTGEGTTYDASRIAILKDIADTVWANTSGAYVILEHFAENSEETELSDYGMMIWGNVTNSYAQASKGSGSGWDFSWASYQERGWNNPNLISYMESHDEERMMYRNIKEGNSSGTYNTRDTVTALKRVELAGAFFFTIPGPKMIWQFEELGYDTTINYPCRVCEKPILWNYYEEENRNDLYRFFKAFINLKKEYEAFSTDEYELDLTGDLKQIILLHSTMNVVIYGNFDVEEHYGIPNLSSSSTWYDYYTQEEYSSASSFTLAPGEYKILTSVKLDLPDIPEIQMVPVASNVIIAGDIQVGETLHGTYTFTDNNGDIEGESIYRWYTAEAANGAGTELISGAEDTTYTLTSAEVGKYIMFEVIPVAVSESKTQGDAVRSDYTNEVMKSYVVKPTLVYDYIYISELETYDFIRISDLKGEVVFELVPENNNEINLSSLRPGLYLIILEKDGEKKLEKVVKM